MNHIEARHRLVQSYEETGSYSQTARLWHTSRHVVRKWVRRYQELGQDGLQDQSRRPHHCPRQTPPKIEQQLREAWENTHYGRYRLALYLTRQALYLSPHTVRHILRHYCPPQKRRRRKPLYPAHWAWKVELPFSLIQTDVKDIHDKGALGTQRTTHSRHQGLPSYQWPDPIGQTYPPMRTDVLPRRLVGSVPGQAWQAPCRPRKRRPPARQNARPKNTPPLILLRSGRRLRAAVAALAS